MSVTILRLGIWTIILVMVAYVLRETILDETVAEIITDDLLFLILQVAGGLVLLGFIIGLIERARRKSRKKCATCGTRIDGNAIYCRIHLNQVVEEEDLRRRTMSTRLPE